MENYYKMLGQNWAWAVKLGAIENLRCLPAFFRQNFNFIQVDQRDVVVY
jgi:hypothetical protein